MIRDKKRKLIPLIPNEVQAVYLDMVAPGWREGEINLRGLREILLKARQFGFSTLILALYYLDTINTPNTRSVILAHNPRSTDTLFQQIQRFHENLRPEIKPRTKYANRREYLYPDLGSSIFVGQVGKDGFGRGDTINNVHMSELAFWPKNAEDIVTGLLEAVPEEGNATIETTANGVGNYYHAEYELAQGGKSAFTARFFGWYQHREYRRQPEPDFERTAEEEELARVYGLDDWQLAWRRWKKRQAKKKFKQEYPINAQEAFLTSGNNYFDRDVLATLSDALTRPEHAPLSRDAFNLPAGSIRLAAIASGDEDERGGLEVFKAPEPGRTYVIGADTAEGINDYGDHDFSCADVLDAETWEQVAHIHGRWDPRYFGLTLAELARWYNNALLGIERNNHGHAVINAALYEAGYPEQRQTQCSGVYMHQEYDENQVPKDRRPGWPETPKNKFFALDGLATALLDSDLKLHSRGTAAELHTFVNLPGGRAGGEGRSHDDRVMSLAIAVAMIKLRPRGGWATDPKQLERLKELLKGQQPPQ
jgi:hypothetical protein